MRAVVVVLALTLLAGCSFGRDGGEGASAPPAASTDRSGAPVIVAPRDLASRAADPCTDLLGDSEVRMLGYDPPGESSTSLAGSPTCTWRRGSFDRQVDASVVLQGDLFVQTYRDPGLPIFRPLEIAGLPAVDLQSFPDAPTCTTTVGVADDESLDITVLSAIGRGGRPASDPCEEGHRVAEAIVSTLPPK